MNGAWTMYMGVGVSENGGSPSQHGCFNTNSWSNDLDDDWGTPIFGNLHIYIMENPNGWFTIENPSING